MEDLELERIGTVVEEEDDAFLDTRIKSARSFGSSESLGHTFVMDSKKKSVCSTFSNNSEQVVARKNLVKRSVVQAFLGLLSSAKERKGSGEEKKVVLSIN